LRRALALFLPQRLLKRGKNVFFAAGGLNFCGKTLKRRHNQGAQFGEAE